MWSRHSDILTGNEAHNRSYAAMQQGNAAKGGKGSRNSARTSKNDSKAGKVHQSNNTYERDVSLSGLTGSDHPAGPSNNALQGSVMGNEVRNHQQ